MRRKLAPMCTKISWLSTIAMNWRRTSGGLGTISSTNRVPLVVHHTATTSANDKVTRHVLASFMAQSPWPVSARMVSM